MQVNLNKLIKECVLEVLKENLSNQQTPNIISPEGNVLYLKILDISNLDDPSYKLIHRLRDAIAKKAKEPDLSQLVSKFNQEFGGSSIGNKPAWDYYSQLEESKQEDYSQMMQRVETDYHHAINDPDKTYFKYKRDSKYDNDYWKSEVDAEEKNKRDANEGFRKSFGQGGTIYKQRQGGRDVYWTDNKDSGGKLNINPDNLSKYIRQGYNIIDINEPSDPRDNIRQPDPDMSNYTGDGDRT